MSFRFNFEGDSLSGKELGQTREEIQWLESECVVPGRQIGELDDLFVHARMLTYGDVEIGHILINDAVANMKKDNLENASKLTSDKNSDLVTGKYEGGLKIWECTHDLIKYLVDNENEINLENSKVLDLGCGAGILGIYAFLKGSVVTFQDYNKEVLEYVTIPNVLLNIEEEQDREIEVKKCSFFSGDWASFNTILEESDNFDLIVTSETIYNETNYGKLIKLFTKRLNVNGVIYVAAKTCYFGVGGGVRQFERAIHESNLFNCEVCWKNDDGIQREILKITRKLNQ